MNTPIEEIADALDQHALQVRAAAHTVQDLARHIEDRPVRMSFNEAAANLNAAEVHIAIAAVVLRNGGGA